MRELALLLFLLAAAAAPNARAQDGCRATGASDGEVAVCGDTSELDATALQAAAAAAAGTERSSSPRPPPADGLASGSSASAKRAQRAAGERRPLPSEASAAQPIGPADRENVPKGRRN